jgi:hypothetical protein
LQGYRGYTYGAKPTLGSHDDGLAAHGDAADRGKRDNAPSRVFDVDRHDGRHDAPQCRADDPVLRRDCAEESRARHCITRCLALLLVWTAFSLGATALQVLFEELQLPLR